MVSASHRVDNPTYRQAERKYADRVEGSHDAVVVGQSIPELNALLWIGARIVRSRWTRTDLFRDRAEASGQMAKVGS